MACREGLSLPNKRATVARRRQRWRSWQAGLDPERLVFIDETWIKTNMAPIRGWGPKGRRLRGYAPHGHWQTMTFLAALRCDQLTAPFVFDGPINGAAYVEQQLAHPQARRHRHHGQPRKPQIQEPSKPPAPDWFLPPYSPDLNPIEQAFARIKHWMSRTPGANSGA